MRFPDDYRPRVGKINDFMMRSLNSIENPNLRAAMAHYPAAGGKRLRPLLATMACEAVGGEADAAIPYGVSLEMVHNFTLVHDDVMDEDDTRRGIKTVHAAYGTPRAILSGDALFARAFEIIPEAGVSPAQAVRLVEIIARSVRLLAEGQQMDMDFEKAGSVTSAEYMKMIELKTAVLYSAAAEGGAVVGGGSEKHQKALGEYGRLVGLGFQIWDDVLDLTSDKQTFGKPVLNDIRNGKKTLIVINALEDLAGEERSHLLRVLGDKKAAEKDLLHARDILQKAGSIDHAEKVAKGLVAEGKEKLRVLKSPEHRKALEDFADYMLSRKT